VPAAPEQCAVRLKALLLDRLANPLDILLVAEGARWS
jgi:hypothetical protein